MKFLAIFAMIIGCSAGCMATQNFPFPTYMLIDDENASDLLTKHRFEFDTGSTILTCYDYHIKITAEQRFSDKELLVIAFPQEMGAAFQIDTVRIGTAPRYNLEGPVCLVAGVFRARINENNPISVHMTIPIQINPVNDFTVSSHEALIQGNQFVQRKLPNMVTGDMP